MLEEGKKETKKGYTMNLKIISFAICMHLRHLNACIYDLYYLIEGGGNQNYFDVMKTLRKLFDSLFQ